MRVKVMVEIDSKYPSKVAEFMRLIANWAENAKPHKCVITSRGRVESIQGEWKGSTP